ncbi:ABC transporter permease [Bacillus subtilis subsp. subtilis]|uniref:Probable amino-acid permease protein YxeN n=3 Tax=Bacillus subtilis subsp. subtilis TaxID=135461 RepID=YXEN_BACSU|nr:MULTISPECIES: amino acid ABC transporter permease [Bacillales]NP_391828.1 putative ABC transporter (permease) [Bacillus subtilis subsp. subtilis str. 168]P54953.1 RecName: Full=Probable amino-acid permease protein YxeN [Bacillus subtilis subsp. subtilis str. 168]AOL31680.1 ABC transporter permease [Alkalicoccobacillus gibsonii]WJD92428.1 amino acid ABC transporter permease [Bacillus spizizenii]BAM56035.1 ABC transporter permease [Bacillus subtilis BEST7613]AEP93019.1 amino acid ABC transpo
MNTIDWEFMISAFPTLIQALPITLFMAIAAMIFAIIGGLILALITKNKIPVLHQLSKLYISFFRGVPTLVQLFLIYYGLPQLFPEMSKMTALTAAIIGLSLKNAAYLAEIFRAALNSVDDGQLEACLSVGMTKFQAYRRIILPQAIRNAIPATGNTFIGLLKETSLAFTLGVMEMFAQGKMYASGNLKYFETYLAVAIVYWVLTIIYSILQDLFERAMSKPYRT